MPSVKCQKCEKDFNVKSSRLQKGWGKYCSNECKHAAFQMGKIVACSTCRKEVYKSPKDHRRSISGKFFCSKSCQTTWRNSVLYTGKNHLGWKSGINVYRNILRRTGAPQMCAKCQTDDPRVLAVHHKDKNRQNNAANNLVWLCHNCHFLVHHYAEESNGFLQAIIKSGELV